MVKKEGLDGTGFFWCMTCEEGTAWWGRGCPVHGDKRMAWWGRGCLVYVKKRKGLVGQS